MKCPGCRESEMNEGRENYRYTESGLPNVTLVDVTVRQCPKCGNRVVAIPRLEGLHQMLAFLVATQTARLSGAEMRFLRKHLGWSGSDFAKTIGVAPETVSRWENEKEPMGVVAERLLRLMALREKPVSEYPTEKLAEVAQDNAHPPRLSLRASKTGWHEDKAA